tara:strand:- start:1601 stop:1774 length:174 start_codon:yes stop_codon:yes gene_type:complete
MPKFKDPMSGKVTRAPYTKAGYKKIKDLEDEAKKKPEAKKKRKTKTNTKTKTKTGRA